MTNNRLDQNGKHRNADPVLVVLQLSGGNDILNTVAPYGDGLYYDFRPTTGIAEDRVIPLDNRFGLHPTMGPIKDLWDRGNVAIVNGVGLPKPRPFSLPFHGHLAHCRAGKDRR